MDFPINKESLLCSVKQVEAENIKTHLRIIFLVENGLIIS